ncbi:hypothetical protein BH11VER1_BH11VER1_39210 [soil metagenome]
MTTPCCLLVSGDFTKLSQWNFGTSPLNSRQLPSGAFQLGLRKAIQKQFNPAPGHFREGNFTFLRKAFGSLVKLVR